MTATPRAPLDLRQEHGVETPEHVEVRLELAGVGSRTAAWLIDMALIGLAWLVAGTVLVSLAPPRAPGELDWSLAILLLLNAFLLSGYFAICEAAAGGRTPGKQILGLRTVMDTGKRVTVTAAVVRALFLIIDVPLLIGPILMAFHASNKRLGDLAAGTIVVRDRPTEWTPMAAVETADAAEPEPVEAGPPQLSDDEFKLLDQFLARMHQLDAAVQMRLQSELVGRFAAKVPQRERPADAYLVELFGDEQQRRRGRFATRARPGAAGRTTVTAERFVARRRDTWMRFDDLARRVERDGLRALPPGEIPPFAARYREVAADLARARTYGVDQPVIAYLERLVSAGHNALYRGRSRARPPLGHYLLRDFPGAVVESWRHVVAAFVLFAVPAGVGYAILRERPALADTLTSPIMIDRAERAGAEQTAGRGYAQAEAREQGPLSLYLIGNNVRVSFNALVGGIFAGTVTVLVLITNGLMLGVVFGLFANYGAAGYLATFIIGHGVLELTAIFIAAGAGFRIAGAIIAPGDRTRKDALVLEGIIAARMIGAVVCLLVLAGTIEGLLSASDAPPALKWTTGGVTAVLLALYLKNGARYRRGASPSQRRTTA